MGLRIGEKWRLSGRGRTVRGADPDSRAHQSAHQRATGEERSTFGRRGVKKDGSQDFCRLIILSQVLVVSSLPSFETLYLIPF